MIIHEQNVSDISIEELKSLRKYYENMGYITCLQIYEGFVDVVVLEVYEDRT